MSRKFFEGSLFSANIVFYITERSCSLKAHLPDIYSAANKGFLNGQSSERSKDDQVQGVVRPPVSVQGRNCQKIQSCRFQIKLFYSSKSQNFYKTILLQKRSPWFRLSPSSTNLNCTYIV